MAGKWFVALLFLPALAALADEPRTSTVGMPARIEQLLLPGTELEARPLIDRKSPIVLRIEASFRHGDSYRYDLVYYGLDPGDYDLRDYLRRKDGSQASELPPIPVTIKSVLPPGQVEPTKLGLGLLPRLGGYWLALAGGGVLWIAGLLAILLVGRRRRRTAAEESRPRTLAERLRPLVEEAAAGRLPHERLAELERLLLAWWRKRLRLEEERPAAAIAALRQHPEAGGLLSQLEAWLHQPASHAAVDVAALLKPYQNLPADALEFRVG
jgi:hypothetical protein